MPERLLTHMYYSNFHLARVNKGFIEHLAISFQLYELGHSLLSISMVLMREMGVFTSSNILIGSDGVFLHISSTLPNIVVISLNLFSQ